jgi:hypothetical protein
MEPPRGEKWQNHTEVMLTCNRSREEKPNGVELLASILHLTKLQNIIQSYTTLRAQTKFSSGGGTRCDISNFDTAQRFGRWHPKTPLPIAKPLLLFDLHNEKNLLCVYFPRICKQLWQETPTWHSECASLTT